MAMEAKGDQLVQEADQALKKWSLFSGNDKYEDAADKYQRAGNAYKAAKSWLNSANAYQKAADAWRKAKSDNDIATCYTEAARCFVKAGDTKLAGDLLENEVLPRMVDAGRLSQAAKLHQEVADMCEEEHLLEQAIEHHQKAADLFLAENAASTAQKSLTKVAFLSAQLDPPDFDAAAQQFEHVATEQLSSNLMKFSAKGNFFNALICTLARGDIVVAENNLNRYKDLDYTFGGSRECRLLEDICAAYKDGSVDAFTDAVYNFDQISKLDPWRTGVLLKIKTSIQKSVGEGSDLT